jgi:dTDP-4-dehydrorhamnose reductase
VNETAKQGIEFQALRREQIDFSKPELIRAQLGQYAEAFAPTHVINATAYTAVDRAELEPELATSVNAESVAELGHVCGALGLPLIHFSTDYVFNGRLPLTEAYRPDNPTDPQSVYGATKRTGEVALMACSANVIVFRTSWVYAAHGSNFFQTMVSAAQRRDQLSVVNDQFGAPTSAHWLARQAIRVCEQRQEGSRILHLTAAGYTHWCDFARTLLGLARQANPSLPWRVTTDEQVQAVSTQQYEDALRAAGRTDPIAPRPKNSRLDSSETFERFRLEASSWQAQLEEVVSLWGENRL